MKCKLYKQRNKTICNCFLCGKSDFDIDIPWEMGEEISITCLSCGNILKFVDTRFGTNMIPLYNEEEIKEFLEGKVFEGWRSGD